MSSGVSQPERPPEQVAIGLIQDAETFRRAALRVAPEDDLSDPAMLHPAWHLLCHSAELTLKAFLTSHGHDQSGRRGGLKNVELRHQLLGLYDAAVEHGFQPPSEEFGELMDWLAPFHNSHAFRYRQTGAATLPAPFFVAGVLAPVIAGVATTVRERWAAISSR